MDQHDDVEDDVKTFWKLIHGVIKASTGLERVRKVKNIEEIPVTLFDAESRVFVVHAVGMFDEQLIDTKLLIIRNSLYFQALKRGDKWYEVCDSEAKIRGASEFLFDGSYISCPPEKLRFGFNHLKRAIMRLALGEPVQEDFLTVAFNLCEPARSKVVANKIYRTIRTHITVASCSLCCFIVRYWGKFCTAIEDYQNNKPWLWEIEKGKGRRIFKKNVAVILVWVIKKVHETRVEEGTSTKSRKARGLC